MKAVVLAAGSGTRLKPLTANRTKGMIPVGNKPILDYLLKALAEAGIREVIMVVGYRKEKIMRYFGDGKDWGVQLKYVTQDKQLGTAHALFEAKPHIEDDFLMLPGDNLIGTDGLKKLIADSMGEEDARLLFTQSENASKYGVLGIEQDKLVKLVEKPKISGDLLSTGVPSIFSLALWEYQQPSISNLISTGSYRFSKDIFDDIQTVANQEKYSLSDLLLKMMEDGKYIKCLETDLWLDAVYPWDVLDMTADVIASTTSTTEGTIEENVIIRGPVSIGKNSIIKANTYITGPVIIGEGCEIGPNVVIAPSTSVGDNVKIDPFTSIRNSIIMDDVSMGTGCMLANSVIAEGVRIGASFVTDTARRSVHLEEYATTKELGAVIGEDSIIGHGVVTESGLLIGTECKIGSRRIVRDNVSDGAKVL